MFALTRAIAVQHTFLALLGQDMHGSLCLLLLASSFQYK